MHQKRKPLSNLEHLVLAALWKHPSATTETVRAALAAKHPLKESSVRTILTRLEDKGYVSHTVDGRSNIYSPTTPPANVAVSAVRQIIDRFCGGSVEQLLLGMIDEEVLDKHELKRLAAKVAARTNRKEN